MISDTVIDIIIQMGVVVLLCIGFTFTYQIEGFPNFAHISIAMIGTVITFTITKLMGYNPYYSLPVSALICGILGACLYVTIVQVIKRRRDGGIALTLAFYALSIVLETLVGIYSYWIVVSRHETTQGFALKFSDFQLYGLPGIAIITTLTSVLLVGILYYALTKTKLGLSLRAVSENESLSMVYGINTLRIHIFSWFIIGALAGIAGSLFPLWTSIRGRFSEGLLVTVMAGSIIGGFDSIYGSVIGGVLITMFQRGLTIFLMNLESGGKPLLIEFSLLLRGFEQLIPIVLIFITLMLMPEGIVKYLRFLRSRYL